MIFSQMSSSPRLVRGVLFSVQELGKLFLWNNENSWSQRQCAATSSLVTPVVFAFMIFFKDSVDHHPDAFLISFFFKCMKVLGNDDREAFSIKVCLLVQELVSFLLIVSKFSDLSRCCLHSTDDYCEEGYLVWFSPSRHPLPAAHKLHRKGLQAPCS